jgi:hypothetical protein
VVALFVSFYEKRSDKVVVIGFFFFFFGHSGLTEKEGPLSLWRV